jgi:cobalamin biosynthetic protein CobC
LSTNGQTFPRPIPSARPKRRPPSPPPLKQALPPITLPAHGGAIGHAEKAFGKPAQGWLDLSTAINPWAYPIPDISTDLWRRLPDENLETEVRKAAQRYFEIDALDAVSLAPGTQALIQWLPWLREPGTVGIVGPTYCEHAKAWSAAGHEVTAIGELPDWGDFAVVVVTNPNNPDGKRRFREGLLALAQGQAHAGGLLVVDEAFADVAPDLSIAKNANTEGLCVLRSFGKFFGLAGIRLGFALAHEELANELRTALGPWPVSGPALEIARVALRDQEWISNTRLALQQAADRLDSLLESHGLSMANGTALFRLAAHPNAHTLYRHLAVNGILVRAFEEQTNWLRFGIPGNETDFNRLDTALDRFSG